MKTLRITRVLLALVFLVGITALFADPTRMVFPFVEWMAKLQFWPACLGLSSVAIAIFVLTLVFGRVYCSVACPLGVMQDVAVRIRGIFARRGFPVGVNAPKKAQSVVRALVAAVFFSGGFLGLHFAWLEPYAIYGRLMSVTAAPLGVLANNQVAAWAERHGSYAAVAMENALPPTAFIVFAASLAALVFVLAVWKGRFWCNVVCPVGAVLGLFSKFSFFRPRIDSAACIGCKACERRCKGRCIDVDSRSVDASRCVACCDCSAACPKGAIKWR